MKIINKIKAFFCKENEPVEMDIVAAEIKEGKAFLHPKDQPEVTYLIRSDDIRISLSEGRSLCAHDILSVMPKAKDIAKKQEQQPNKESSKETPAKTKAPQDSTTQSEQHPSLPLPGFEKYKKRTFSVSLYPEEYDRIIENMKEYGYKRADFLLACVQTAKKTSMEKAHKEIVNTHKQMLLDQKELIAQQLAELEQSNQAG